MGRPVVLCTVDRLGLPGLSSLPKTSSVLEAFSPVTLDPLAEDAAHYALGTGTLRPDVKKRIQELVDNETILRTSPIDEVLQKPEQESGTFVDFMTEKEKHRCRVHLFCLSSEGEGASKSVPIAALCDALSWRRLPFVVHVILDGPDKSAEALLDHVSEHLGESGALGTIIGADSVLGSTLSWERALDAYRCIVRDHDGPVEERYFDALHAAHSQGGTDASVPPTRVAGYDGVTGSLQAEFGGGAPSWEWRGFDVGIIATTRGDELVPLVSLLTHQGLPAEVAASMAVRGRPVITFDADSLASFTRIGPLSVRPLVETKSDSPGLFGRLTRAGKRGAKIVQASRRTLATFTFEGEAASSSDVLELQTAPAAIQGATEVVRGEGVDFVHVAVANTGGEGATHALDDALATLAKEVLDRRGTLFVVANDGPIAIVARLEESDETGLPRSHVEIHASILDALGIDAHDADDVRRLRRRR